MLSGFAEIAVTYFGCLALPGQGPMRSVPECPIGLLGTFLAVPRINESGEGQKPDRQSDHQTCNNCCHT